MSGGNAAKLQGAFASIHEHGAATALTIENDGD
jgi:hypothetical protein